MNLTKISPSPTDCASLPSPKACYCSLVAHGTYASLLSKGQKSSPGDLEVLLRLHVLLDPLTVPGGWGLARAGAPKLGYGWGTKGKMMEPEKFIDLLWCLNHTVLKANQHQ